MKSSNQAERGAMVVSVGVQSHVGRERSENQDRITRSRTPFGDLFIVADGMGGYRGGSEAAQATIDGFAAYLNAHGELTLPQALQGAVQAVREELRQRSLVDASLTGMGSTVVLCVVKDDRVTYAHAGDSRAYLARSGRLQQLTRDHSMMERFVAQGVLTPEQAREHPDASVLTRAIGSATEVALDVAELQLQPGDALLLCSDGLWGYAQPGEMELIATSEVLSPAAVADALLNLALEGGGGDNISIQFLRFAATKAPQAQQATRTSRVPLVVAIAIAIVLSAGAAGLFVWNYEHPLSTLHLTSMPNPVAASQHDLPQSAPAKPTPVHAPAKQHRDNNEVEKLQDDVTKQVDRLPN